MKVTQIILGSVGLSVLAFAATLTDKINTTNPDYITLSEFKKKGGFERKKQKIAGALEWQKMVRANQVTGLIDPMDIENAKNEANRLMRRNTKVRATLASTSWEETGPNNIGGRARALVIDKNNSNKLYIGTSGGGLWISNDGGNNWTKRVGNDSTSAIAVCALTQAANGDLYYGTGEGFGAGIPYTNGAQTQLGEGIYKSTDGGASFTQLSATKPSNLNSSSDQWTFINKLVSHPNDASKIFAATGSGLKVTIDGGATWAKPASLSTSNFMADVEISTSGDRVVAATSNAIYISNDAGNTFGASIMGQNGMPVSAGLGRIDVAIAPSNPDYLYACLATSGSVLKGIYKSIDGGQNWTTIGVGGSAVFDPLGEQAFWNIAFGVHPTNPDMVFLGGQLDLYRYTPADLWKPIANWQGNSFFGTLVHADMHGIFFNPSDANTMYVVNDGGFYRTHNCTASDPFFAEQNKNLNATQCYGVAANTLGHVVFGAQDNGSGLMGKKANSMQEANVLTGGDGMRCAISSLNPNVVFTSTYGGSLNRATDGGASAMSFKHFFDVNVDANNDGDPEEGAIWNAPIFLKEKKIGSDNASVFLFGTNSSVWLTQGATNAKAVWFKIGSMPGAGVSALCIPKNTNNIAYIGTSSGGVYRINLPSMIDSVYKYNDSLNNTGAFNYQGNITQTLIGNFPGRYITDIDASADGKVTYVTLGNYGNTAYIYKSSVADTASTVASASFADFGAGLPKMPIYSVLCLDGSPSRILIGTELGVWGSEGVNTPQWLEVNRPGNDETKWHPRAATYEVIDVSSLWNKDGSVYAGPVVYTGTHGRGTFRSTTHANYWPVGIERVNDNSISISLYPNPASSSTTISYQSNIAGKASIKIYSLTGSLVKTITADVSVGENKIPLQVNDLANGGYIVYMVSGGNNATTKFVKQ